MKKFTKIFVFAVFAFAFLFSWITFNEEVRAATKTVYVVQGGTEKIKVNKATKKTTWKVSNKKVVSVSKRGKNYVTVKGIKKGNSTIQAKINGKTVKYKIVVENPKLSATTFEMAVGDYEQLKVTGTKQSVTWSSSDSSIVDVSEYSGYISGESTGTATITAKVGKKKYKCKVTVDNPKLSKDDISFPYVDGDSETVTMTGTNRNVVWTSENENVATVENGVITPKGSGFTTINAKVGKNSYHVYVTVSSYAKPVNIPFGQTWTVPGQWELRIDGATKTDDRNKYSSKNPTAVYIVKYTYKNIGYQDAEGLWLSLDLLDNVIDSTGQTGYEYPGDVSLYPSHISYGASCTAEECIGLEHDGSFTIQISKMDNSGITRTAILGVSVQ